MKEYKAKFKNDNVIIDLEENTFRIHYVKNLVELENSIIDKIPSIFGVNKIENEDDIIKYEDISEIKTNIPLLGYSKIFFLKETRIFYEFEGLHKNEVKEIEQFIKGYILAERKRVTELQELQLKEEQKKKNQLLELQLRKQQIRLKELQKSEEKEQHKRALQNLMVLLKNLKQNKSVGGNETRGSKIITSAYPPPPPVFSYYAMIENKQQGPYNKIQFKRLVDNNLINKASLVWKEGMSKWEKAKEVEDMEEFFTQENPNTPPILPAGPASPPPPPISY